MAVLAAIAALIITSLLPPWEIRVVPPRPWSVKSSTIASVAVPVPPVTISTTEPAAITQTPFWPRVALAIWLTGVAIGAVTLAAGILRLYRLIAESASVTHDGWIRATAAISRQYRLRRNTRLLETVHPSVLVTCGLLRPRILIPSGTANWTEARIVSVLRHELAHVRRFDWPLQMTSQMLRILLWFNPLAWIVCARLRFESECACDDLAISAGIDNVTYANDLLAVARQMNAQTDAWSSAIGMAERSSLQRRFVAMLDPSTNRQPLTSRIRLAIVVVFMSLVLPLSVLQARQDFTMGTAPQVNASRSPEPARLPRVETSVAIRLDLSTAEFLNRATYTPPRVLNKVDIVFPTEAKEVRFQGTEVVRAMIHTDGPLQVQEVLTSLDATFLDICRRQISAGRWPDAPYATAAACPEHLGFDDATTQALRQWRFAPALRDGVPVTTMLNIAVHFSLH
jgi:beta-lactamase regulating signal transducer with metallopeptidase domain